MHEIGMNLSGHSTLTSVTICRDVSNNQKELKLI